ncbi:hypothetical protein B0H19DRAFT_1203859 [Mycena capillaripes]|nr:hypothetical protein B0H19DRAFT_1203859 [Mycena capillaripes]
MFSLASITIACILGLVSATPSARQVTCSPDFGGAGVSIATGDAEWSVSPPFAMSSPANWNVDQTESANPRTSLTLEQIDSSKQTQIWEIECKQCFPGASLTPGGGVFASGCSIESVPIGLCATLETGSEFLGLADCNGVAAQTFNFWTASRSLVVQSLNKRCDMDFFEDCIGTCNNPTCPLCNTGCVIGCCGSTGCC